MMENRIKQMKLIQEEALELFIRKNSDYGDAFEKFDTLGVLIRMSDKMQRFVNLQSKPSSVLLVEDEELRDTLIDLHNYAAMAIMLLDDGK